MAEEIVLYFDTVEGEYPDTEIVAKALLDWVALANAAAQAINPYQRLDVEIAGVAPGSTRFPQLLKFVDQAASDVSTAWEEVPYLKKLVIGAAHTFWTATISASVNLAMMPDMQMVELSEHDRILLTEMRNSVANSGRAQQASQQFYKTLQPEGTIKGVGVAESWREKKPHLIIPRSEFAERSGLWTSTPDAVRERPGTAIWDVVLLKAPFESRPLSWRFSRDGLPFSARMEDKSFLDAMRERRLPITLSDGVQMRIEMEFTERLIGDVWEPVESTRKVTNVLSPVPLSQPPPFSADEPR